MRNFLITFFTVAIAAYLLQPFLPWWIVAVIAFAVGFLVKQHAIAAFSASLLGVFTLWVVYAFTLSAANDHLLAGKIAALLGPLTGGSVVVLFILTGLVGGLVAGLAGLCGRFTAQAIKA